MSTNVAEVMATFVDGYICGHFIGHICGFRLNPRLWPPPVATNVKTCLQQTITTQTNHVTKF